jgi:hypothetical protein
MISVIINADTRNENPHAEHMLNGCASHDFLTHGVLNKIKFFEHFHIEVILFIDEHSPVANLDLPDNVKVVISPHKQQPKFNDYNYINALSLAQGDIIAHFDQDCAAFTSGPEHVNYLIGLLDTYDYVSYPARHSPFPVHDETFDYTWVSTRFFMCRRETLNLPEITKCIQDADYLYDKYPATRRCPWTEHVLGLISKYSGRGVFYPPMHSDFTIFCWKRYRPGTLQRLNSIPFSDIRHQITLWGDIQYPCDIEIR